MPLFINKNSYCEYKRIQHQKIPIKLQAISWYLFSSFSVADPEFTRWLGWAPTPKGGGCAKLLFWPIFHRKRNIWNRDWIAIAPMVPPMRTYLIPFQCKGHAIVWTIIYWWYMIPRYPWRDRGDCAHYCFAQRLLDWLRRTHCTCCSQNSTCDPTATVHLQLDERISSISTGFISSGWAGIQFNAY